MSSICVYSSCHLLVYVMSTICIFHGTNLYLSSNNFYFSCHHYVCLSYHQFPHHQFVCILHVTYLYMLCHQFESFMALTYICQATIFIFHVTIMCVCHITNFRITPHPSNISESDQPNNMRWNAKAINPACDSICYWWWNFIMWS